MKRNISRSAVAVLAISAIGLAVGLSGCSSSAASTGGSVLTMELTPTGPLARNFNPFNVSNAGYVQGTQSFVYEPLIQFNLASAGKEYPWLASSYDWSSDGKSITFHLRDNVTWTDGKPFSAADVAFTYNLIRKNPGLNTTGIAIDSATATNKDTVVLTFPEPSFSQLFNIASVPIVSEHIWSKVSDPSTYADANPVGTGPYTLTSFDNQGWTMTANPHYWQAGKPAVKKIQVPIFNDASSATLALQQGKLDWAGDFIANIATVYKAKDPAHYQYWQPGYSTVTIVPNLAAAPLNDVAVRQAVSAALDRKQISDAGTQGQEPPALSATGIVLPSQQAYLSDDLKQYDTKPDVAAAKSILQKAGYTMGSDGYFVSPSGKQLAFSLEQPSNYADFMTDAQVAATQLKAAGIKVTVAGVSVQKYTADLSNGTFQAAIHVGVPGPTPYYQFDYWMDSKLTAPVGKAAASNFSRFSSSAADQLLAQYANTNDESAQKAAISGLGKIVATQLPVIPLLYGANWAQFNTKRFTGFPSASNPYSLPAPASPYSEYTILQLKPVK
jgi:peptide/nickel transport system substrate-binding protein